MKFLIAHVSPESIEEFGSDGYFTNNDEDYYAYKVELDEDTLYINDGCGRGVPIDHTEIHAFQELFTRLVTYMDTKALMEKELYEILSEGADPL